MLAHDPQVLILDEPTAALGETDSIRILDMVARLRERGKSIIYVSHRMDEIFKICDRITVLRDGESQEPRAARDLNVEKLVELMLGRELGNMFPARVAKPKGDPLMQVRDLWPDGVLEPVNFDVYPGEILGLAGQLGAGTAEILAAMAGAAKTRGGKLIFDGREFLPKRPKEAIAAGIGYCSEDRKHDGLFSGPPDHGEPDCARVGPHRARRHPVASARDRVSARNSGELHGGPGPSAARGGRAQRGQPAESCVG